MGHLLQHRHTSFHQATFTLIEVKTKGGLKVPSDGVIRLLLCAERCLRRTVNIHVVSKKYCQLHLEKQVLSELGGTVFTMQEHMLATAVGADNHYYDLVRLLVRTYFRLRFHHIVRLHNASLQVSKKRHKLNKLILFSGQ